MSENVSCPHCGGLIENDPSLAGQQVSCPHCDGLIVMPRGVAPPPRKKSQAVEQFDFEAGATARHTPSSSSRMDIKPKKEMQPWLKYGLIAFASIAVLRGCIAGMGGGGGGGRGDRITEDFLPHKVEARAIYYLQMNDGVIKSTRSFNEDGVTLHRTVSAGVIKDGKYEQVQFLNLPLTKGRWRVENGYVEIGSNPDDQGWTWERSLKIGAAVGDEWQDDLGNGLIRKHKVIRLEPYTLAYDEKVYPSVTISTSVETNGKPVSYSETLYVKGIGQVDTKTFTFSDGEKKLAGHLWLDVRRKSGRMPSGEQMFFE